MNGHWAVFRDGRKHFVSGPVGTGVQPSYAACGKVEIPAAQAAGLLPAVCARCKAKTIEGRIES